MVHQPHTLLNHPTSKSKFTKAPGNIHAIKTLTKIDTPEPYDEYYPEELEDENPTDIYEVFKEGVKVHSKTGVYNEDVTLSDLTNNERVFTREQIKTAYLLKQYIQHPSMKERIYKDMMLDVNHAIITSRAKNARIVEGLIKMITGQAYEQKEDIKNMTFWQKLTRPITGQPK